MSSFSSTFVSKECFIRWALLHKLANMGGWHLPKFMRQNLTDENMKKKNT